MNLAIKLSINVNLYRVPAGQGIKKLSGKMGNFPQMSGKNDSLEVGTKILGPSFIKSC